MKHICDNCGNEAHTHCKILGTTKHCWACNTCKNDKTKLHYAFEKGNKKRKKPPVNCEGQLTIGKTECP